MCDINGNCSDSDRDWCPKCEQCVVYAGEKCTSCGYEWGDD